MTHSFALPQSAIPCRPTHDDRRNPFFKVLAFATALPVTIVFGLGLLLTLSLTLLFDAFAILSLRRRYHRPALRPLKHVLEV